jgi:hypothetical protein
LLGEKGHSLRGECDPAQLVAHSAHLLGLRGNGEESLLHLDPAPHETEDLVATKARQEEQTQRAGVAGRVEAADQRTDLVVGKDAGSCGLVFLLQPTRRVLLEQPIADRPTDEASKGAEGAIPRRGCLGSHDHSLDLPRRDLGEELLPEHALEPADVGQGSPGRASLESASPPAEGPLLPVLAPRRQRVSDRFAESSLSRRLPLRPPLGLRVLAACGTAPDDRGQFAGGGETGLGVLSDAITPRLALEQVADEPDHLSAPNTQHEATLIGVDPLRVLVGVQAGYPGGRHSYLWHRVRAFPLPT